MHEPHDEHHEGGKEQPEDRSRDPRGRAQHEDDGRDDRLTPPHRGAQGVSSVELADREQVQARDEQAEPRGHERRVLVHRRARVGRDSDEMLSPAHDQRVFEERRVRGERQGARPRMRDSVQEERDRREEPRDRARDADVEQHRLAPDRLLDADEGSERAGQVEERRHQQRGRKEVGERSGDAVAAAGQVMPELVDAEDREERDREGDAVEESPVAEEAAARRVQAADERRRQEREDEEEKVEEGVLPARPRRGRLREGIRVRGIQASPIRQAPGAPRRSSSRRRARSLPSELAAASRKRWSSSLSGAPSRSA